MDSYSCFICNNWVNEKAPLPDDPRGWNGGGPGPASSKRQKGGTGNGKQGLPRSLTVTFCKALSLPQEDFKKRLIKSPVCKDCCKRIQKMTHIITELERLEDTVRQFRTEVRDLLETSYKDRTKLDTPVVAMTDPDPPVIPETNDKDTKHIDADETDDCKPTLVLVGDDSRPFNPGCETDRTGVETSNLLLQNPQNECRKQILDILNRRFARVKVTKPKKLIQKPKDVSVKLKTSTRKISLHSATKKIKTQSLVHPIIIGVRSIATTSVTFNDPPASPSVSCNDDVWQPSVEDVNDVNYFSDGTLDEPDYDVVPSPAPSTINEVVHAEIVSNVKSPKCKKEDVKKKKRRTCQDDQSGAETSALDSSDLEDDGDVASLKRKRRKKKFLGDHFCQVCERNFKEKLTLDIHMKRRHDEGVNYAFLCTEKGCTKAFKQKYLLDHHLNEHRTGEKTINKYVCDTCGKGFSTSTSMNRHASSHTGKWKFPCTICTKGFHRPSELANHLHKHADPKHCCKLCEQKFDMKHLLVTHMFKSHPDEALKEKRSCNICHKVFARSALKCHQIQIHQVGECKFTCHICLRGYAKLSWLNRHKLSHTMEKTMICDHEGCGESFRFKSSLRLHKVKHHGTYPHCCDVCGRRFIVKRALELHLSTHSKDKNFLCNFCDKAFSNNNYLRLHVRRVHWEEIGLDERPKYFSRPRRKQPSESKSTERKILKMKESESSEGEYIETEAEDIIESEDDIEENDCKSTVIIGTIEGLQGTSPKVKFQNRLNFLQLKLQVQ